MGAPRIIRVLQGDLTAGSEEILFNASNTNAILGSGVSGAIRKSCGSGYQQKIIAELNQKFGGPMVPGQAFLTDAGSHPTAKFVAHIAVMDYRNGFNEDSHPSLQTIRDGCLMTWKEIEKLPVTKPLSVAVAALGAGVGNLGLRDSVTTIFESLREHGGKSPGSKIGDVSFYGYTFPEYVIIAETLGTYLPIEVHDPEVALMVEEYRLKNPRKS